MYIKYVSIFNNERKRIKYFRCCNIFKYVIFIRNNFLDVNYSTKYIVHSKCMYILLFVYLINKISIFIYLRFALFFRVNLLNRKIKFSDTLIHIFISLKYMNFLYKNIHILFLKKFNKKLS